MSPSDGETDTQLATHNRSQSETLGFVLVFAIMIIGALIVVGLGANAITDTEERLGDSRAEKSMTQFDSKAGLVALGEADSQQVQFATDEGEFYRVREDRGWMRVTMENQSTGKKIEIVNTTLGAVTYEKKETNIAYQGGGVWRKTENGGQMVSPPEFHFRNGTLTLPTVKVTGDIELGSEASISQGNVTQKFPNAANATFTNPLDNHLVTVTVKSDYYEGWAEYFEERTDGKATTDADNKTATLELVVEADYPPVEGGIVTGAGQLTLNNNAEVDSYNSSISDYGPGGQPYQDDSEILASEDVLVENNAILHGDIEAGGDVTIDNNGEIRYGNISYGGSFSNSGTWQTNSEHWKNDNASVSSYDGVRRLIDDQIDNFKNDNDNSAAGDISSNSLSTCPCTLTSGQYYLNSISLTSGDLQLDTSGGQIDIVVDGDVDIDNNQIVDITGNDRVNMFVAGNTEFNNGAKTQIPGDNASQFWMYMKPDKTVRLQNNVQYRGVIYGANSIGTGVDIVFKQNARIFGGVIGNLDFQANNAWVHFDEALSNTETVNYETTAVRITFLHVTVNEIVVES